MMEVPGLRIALYDNLNGLPVEAIDLKSGNFILSNYAIRSPNRRVKINARPFEDGSDVSDASYNNVSESIRLVVTNLSTTGRNSYDQIAEALEQAVRYQNFRLGPKVYLEVDTTGGFGSGIHGFWRSEIKTGTITPDDEALLWQVNAANVVDCTITFTRAYYWESLTLDNLPLSNPNWSLSEIAQVENTTDPAQNYYNYLDIRGEDIAGTLPTPPVITLTNTFGGVDTRNVIASANTFSEPTAYDHHIEAEAADNNFKGTVTGSGTASGNSYMRFQWTETDVTQLATYATDTDNAKGGFFKVIARVIAFTVPDPVDNPALLVRIRLRIDGLTPIYTSPWVSVDGPGHLNLGAVPLPPVVNYSNYPAEDIHIGLEAYNAGTGTKQLDIDFFQILPVLDYRLYFSVGFNLGLTEQLIDDSDSGTVYAVTNAITMVPTYAAIGDPVKVYPQRDARFYFLADESTGTVPDIDRTTQVRIAYRPRRVTL